jgi:homoserine O-acetyltransferase
MKSSRAAGWVFVLAAFASSARAADVVGPTGHSFTIDAFRTESGVVLPHAVVHYGTYGTLNVARDNAILLPSHFMADMTGYDWLVGKDKALDPGKYFLVASELFGNGHSSSPSNMPEPFHGPRFPVMTIRDNVEAVHRMLVEHYHIQHLRAVIGFSMGAQQALQWAVSYPDDMDFVVATSGTAKTYPHGIVRLEGQIAAITLDPAFKSGDYTAEPVAGIRATSLVWLGWLYSQEWWRDALWKTDDGNGATTTLQQAIDKYVKEFFDGADANNLILHMRTWQSNDVGNTAGFHGDTEAALRSIKVPVLYMPSATDLYFPVGDAQIEAGFIKRCTFAPIPSLWGHPAGAGASPADLRFIDGHVGEFLAKYPAFDAGK